MRNPYLHPNGRIKCLESTLLQKQKFEQMLAAKDADGALEFLKDTVYAQAVSGKKAQDYREMHRSIAAEHYAQLGQIYEPFAHLFKIEHDLFNLKILFKHKLGMITQEKASALFSELGSFGRTAFDGALKLELKELAKVFPDFNWVLSNVLSFQPELGDPFLLESLFDRFSLELQYKEAPEIMKEAMRLKIDAANAKLLMRLPTTNRDAKFLERAAISHGNVPRESVIALFGNPADAISMAFKYRFEPAARLPDLNAMEKDADESFLRKVRFADKDVFGPGPILSYFTTRFNEARNIRALLLGKLSNLDDGAIRALLRFAD